MQERPNDPRRVPRLSASACGTALRCPRQLAQLLDPEPLRGGGGQDPAMRLRSSITEVLALAHRGVEQTGESLDRHLPLDPPTHLSVEEGRLYRVVLEHYVEAFEDSDWSFHPAAGTSAARRSRSGLFELAARPDLLFRSSDLEELEVRRFSFRMRVQAPSATETDLATAALLLRPDQKQMRFTTLWTGGSAEVTTVVVDRAAIDSFRDTLNAAVDHALANPESAVAGWWCTYCRFVKGCPEVPQEGIETVLGRMREDL